MPSKIEGARSCAAGAPAGLARGRESASSAGFRSLGCDATTVSAESSDSSEREDLAESFRAELEAADCARPEGVSPNGEPASPPLFRIQRRLLRSATST